MPRTALTASCLAVAAFCVVGCGGHASTTSSAPQATGTTPLTEPTAPPRPGSRKTKRKPTRTTPSATRTTTSAATPAGLRGAGGYGSNENCTSNCSGSVPSALNRPLHLPASGCPVASPSGPVTPSPASSTLAAHSFVGSPWFGARVTWTAASSYAGPVLIRGRQLGGGGAIGFGVGHVPTDSLQLPAGGARQWPSFTRIQSSGCYAYQVDGTSFSNVIVFRATTGP